VHCATTHCTAIQHSTMHYTFMRSAIALANPFQAQSVTDGQLGGAVDSGQQYSVSGTVLAVQWTAVTAHSTICCHLTAICCYLTDMICCYLTDMICCYLTTICCYLTDMRRRPAPPAACSVPPPPE
jgi:hypothetical protein